MFVVIVVVVIVVVFIGVCCRTPLLDRVHLLKISKIISVVSGVYSNISSNFDFHSPFV